MLDTLVEATRGGAFSAVVGGALSRYTEQGKRLHAPDNLSYISNDAAAWIEYLAGDGLYCWSLLSSEDDLRRPRYTVERDTTGADVMHEHFTLRGANDLFDGCVNQSSHSNKILSTITRKYASLRSTNIGELIDYDNR